MMSHIVDKAKAESGRGTQQPTPSPEFPKNLAKGSGSSEGYLVEARCTIDQPQTIAGMILGPHWQRVDFVPSPLGVPTRRDWALDAGGVLSYAAAQALRWWFLAQATANYSHFCVETRLVKHTVIYSYDCQAVEGFDVVGGRDICAPADGPKGQDETPDAVFPG